MDLEGTVLAEVSQTRKAKYHLISNILDLKHKINEQTKQKQTAIFKWRALLSFSTQTGLVVCVCECVCVLVFSK